MRNPLLLLLLFTSLLAQNGPPNPATRVERWHADLEQFAGFLKGANHGKVKDVPPGQKDLAKLYPNLDADIAAIEAEVPKLHDGEIQLRLARLMAGAHIAHNSASLGTPPQVLPRMTPSNPSPISRSESSRRLTKTERTGSSWTCGSTPAGTHGS